MKIVKLGFVALMASCCLVTAAVSAEAKPAKSAAAKTTTKASKPTKKTSKSAPKTEAAKSEAPKVSEPTPAKAEPPTNTPGAESPKTPATATTSSLIDCTVSKDPRCNRPSGSFGGTIGGGQKIMGTSGFPHIGEGFVEGNRLVAAVEMGGQMDDQGGIFAFDLTTGDRTMLSGKIEDPAKGPINVGTGPDLGNVRAVAQAGSSWVALVSKGSTDATIVRIDPKTGNRTLEMKLERLTCTGTTAKLQANNLGGIAGGPDGTAYVSVGNAAKAVGILAIKGTSCSVVTMSGANGFETKGGGVTIDSFDSYKALRYESGKIWALHGISNSLMTIDVATGNRARISSGESSVRVGNGDAKLGSQTLVISGTRVWTAGAWTGREFLLTEVNPATGDRIAHRGVAGPASRDSNNGVWMHPTKPLVIVTIDNAIALFDPATGNSNLLSH